MPKAKNEKVENVFRCKGGNSFGCNHGPYRAEDGKWSEDHERGIPYYCRKCESYMGCHKCAQIPQEIVCLRCHDWALDAGEREHGRMMRHGNIPVEVKDLLHNLTEKLG